jgi:hypothetical protein
MLILELGARFFLALPYHNRVAAHAPLFNDQANDILSCHNNLGWTGTPNFQGAVTLSDSKVKLRFNALGMHDTEHSLQKPPNSYRVLMMGDSYIHAIQVDEKYTAHQVLENYLKQLDPAQEIQFEVISGGVTGWGTGQQLIYYREQGRQFQPDLVLLMFFIGNDFENNLPGHVLTIQEVNCYAPYFAWCDGQFYPDPLPYAPGVSSLRDNCSATRRSLIKFMGFLYQHSRLYQQLEPLIISYRPREIFGKGFSNSFWALYLPQDEVALEQSWQVTQALFAEMKQEVEADGARFGVVFFPWSVVIEFSVLSPEQQRALLAQENPIFASVESKRPNHRLAGFLSAKNIPFIDLTDPLMEYYTTQDAPLYFVGDGHWTIEGNRFVAETLMKWLIANDLLPK